MKFYKEERKRMRWQKFFSFIIAIAVALAIIFLLATIITQVVLWQKRAQSDLVLTGQERETAIGEIKTIFAEVYDPAQNRVKEPDYIRPNGAPEEVFQAVDIYFSRFVRLAKALDFLAPHASALDNLPESVWQEVGIPKKNGQFLFWYSGIKAARALYDYARLPRQPAGVEGEPFVWPFADRAEITGAIISILVEIKSSPKEIAASDEALRAIALDSLRSQILAISEQVAAGKVATSAGKKKIAALVKRGIENWHFSERELGADRTGKIFRPKKGRVVI